jgi:hypothetical protein
LLWHDLCGFVGQNIKSSKFFLMEKFLDRKKAWGLAVWLLLPVFAAYRWWCVNIRRQGWFVPNDRLVATQWCLAAQFFGAGLGFGGLLWWSFDHPLHWWQGTMFFLSFGWGLCALLVASASEDRGTTPE